MDYFLSQYPISKQALMTEIKYDLVKSVLLFKLKSTYVIRKLLDF